MSSGPQQVEDLASTVRSQGEMLARHAQQQQQLEKRISAFINQQVLKEVKQLSETVKSQGQQVKELSSTVEELSATVMAQQRFTGKLMLKTLTKEVEVGELLEGFADVVAPSVGLIRRIIADGGAADVEDAAGSTLFTKVYELAKDRGSDSLRKVTAQMLGSLILKSDTKPEDIEFLEDDVQSLFSSTSYPRLLNEDDFFYKMEAAFMYFGSSENGLPSKVKEKLLLLLDLPMLSFSATRRVEMYLKQNKWGPPVLAELRLREFIRPKRAYKLDPPIVIVTEVDLRDDITHREITNRFTKEPDTMCILDVSGFLDESGKLVAGKLEGLPSSVRHLSFSNGSRCTAIGDDFLNQHPSLTTADFSCLSNVTRIGNKFLSQCKSLTLVCLPQELQTVGYEFLSNCSSLAMDVPQYKLGIVVTEADLREDVVRREITDRFTKDPEAMCIVDVSGFLDESGELLAGKLEGLPSSVRHLSFVNGSCCTAIGDDFLNLHPSLTTADFSCLPNVMRIGHKFLFSCRSLVAGDISTFKKNAKMIGLHFLGGSPLLTKVDLYSFEKVKCMNGPLGHGFVPPVSSLKESMSESLKFLEMQEAYGRRESLINEKNEWEKLKVIKALLDEQERSKMKEQSSRERLRENKSLYMSRLGPQLKPSEQFSTSTSRTFGERFGWRPSAVENALETARKPNDPPWTLGMAPRNYESYSGRLSAQRSRSEYSSPFQPSNNRPWRPTCDCYSSAHRSHSENESPFGLMTTQRSPIENKNQPQSTPTKK